MKDLQQQHYSITLKATDYDGIWRSNVRKYTHVLETQMFLDDT